MICENLDAEYVRYRSADEGSTNYSVLWEAQGDNVKLVSGETIQYGQLPSGWTESARPLELDLDDRTIDVTLGERPDGQGSTFVAFGYNTDWLSSDHWVDELGNQVEPCDRE